MDAVRVAADSGVVVRVPWRRVVAVLVASGAVVVTGVVVAPRHPRPAPRLEPVAEVPVVRPPSTTIVPAAPDLSDGDQRVVPRRELPGGVVALDVHAYTALRAPGPGAAVGDLGPAYLGCRVRPEVGPGCVLTTLVRDRADRWRQVDEWFVRWPGGERPQRPDSGLQVRVYDDRAGPVPQYLVAGAVLGDPGTVRLRTMRGDVETAEPDVTRLGDGFWTFRVLLPDPPATVTAYDAQGRRSATWGVHPTDP